jgi:hypothetical protein
MTTKPPLQKILYRILHTEDESKQNHKRTGSFKPQKKKRQRVAIDSMAHNQILKQKKTTESQESSDIYQY